LCWMTSRRVAAMNGMWAPSAERLQSSRREKCRVARTSSSQQALSPRMMIVRGGHHHFFCFSLDFTLQKGSTPYDDRATHNAPQVVHMALCSTHVISDQVSQSSPSAAHACRARRRASASARRRRLHPHHQQCEGPCNVQFDNACNGIAINSDGRIVMADTHNHRVQVRESCHCTCPLLLQKFTFYGGVVDERGMEASWAQRQSEGPGTEGPTHHAKKTNRPFVG
jgi:hypothetical protein